VSAPLSILIEEMVLPAASPREANRIAGALQASLERLYAADAAAGVAWRSSLDRLTLEMPEGRGCDETGRALARALRDRLAAPELKP
jgi:hypothetical protein